MRSVGLCSLPRRYRVASVISLTLIISATFLNSSSAFTTNEQASLVIGQQTFTTNTCNSGGSSRSPPTQSSLCAPGFASFDSRGNLWVVDTGNNRVLQFTRPFSNGQSASLEIGQTSFATNNCDKGIYGPPPTDALCIPIGLAFDPSGNLWISDTDNNRVLRFTPPFSNDENASAVIGPSNFNAGMCNSIDFGPNGLCSPEGLAFDSSGNLWVSDAGNSRVLQFTPPFSKGENASLVIGQPNFTSSLSRCSPTQGALCYPTAISFDRKGHLWVSDTLNNRIVEFARPFSNGENASLVLGQPSFASRTCKSSFFGSQPTQSGVCFPLGTSFDSRDNLWVAELLNNRVMEFVPPFSSGENASLVLGQPTFSTGGCNLGVSGGQPTQNSVCDPGGVSFDVRGNLWVVDSGNSRVLEFARHSSDSQEALT